MVLDWSGCRNARDLGDLPTVDGYKIRAGALLRSDSHERLTAAMIQAVRSGTVSRVVDLRWAWECEANPSPFAGDGIYRHAPMLNDVLTYVPPPDTYAPMLDHNRPRIGRAFRAVAEAPPGGMVVHCQAGRDRTGVLVALLLAVAGVAAQDIAADYALTDACSPQTMLHTLAHLDQRYGGVTAYLVEAGVEPGLAAAVRSRLLE
ncbi:Protein tyrosine/serine phosphatase [Micromonospora viridifaciens]|uniref:Protein tyrosine/serine phosphatase n=1 Tax=Micromonospora viridifaciens TaxID=1881 RepID=A0A1C4VXZ0_MICVI|nr:tyrosine-protein phosphatase [Micromonospora viridifaciens]SCE88876.1 Protein tyrosine/serine phosphatase [Micromonospora viridifaciens]